MAALRCPTSTMTEYDSLHYAKRLEDAGVPKEQAAIHASALSEVLINVVFAKQLDEKTSQIRMEMQNMEARLTSRIDLLRTDVNARFDILEASLRGEIARIEATFRGEIARVEAALGGEIKKLHSMLATVVVTNLALVGKIFFS